MIDGLLVAASGMEAQQNQLDAISNDIANISTPGYQGEEMGFHDLLYTNTGPANGTLVATGDGAAAEVIGRNEGQGAIQQTGRSLDVAIQGPGYIEARRPDGSTGLTRNGALEMNAQGELTTQDGSLLVPPIKIPAGVSSDQIAIAPNGTVSAAGRAVGKLSIVTVPAPGQLLAVGESMFTPTTASGAVRTAAGSTVQQGALEGSNVDLASDMATMMVAQRNYQMDSEAIQMQGQMLQIANQITK